MKRQWKAALLLVFAVLATVFFSLLIHSSTATAANPTTMSFQGKVVNADGTNVTDGTYSFLFKLYTVSSGGSAVWTETQGSVTVTAGVFQVNLGSSCSFFVANACNNNTPIDFNANPNLYLGITFNSDPAGEMNPRVQLQSVPFAFNADKVGGLQVSQLVQLSPGGQQSGFINVSGASTFGSTINGLSLAVAADGFTVAGGTTSRTLTVTGASLTVGDVIKPTNAGTLKVQSNGANALNLDVGGAAAINIANGTTGNAINLGNTTSNPNIGFNGSGTFGTTTGAISINGPTTITGTNTFTVNNALTTLGAGLNVTGNIATSNGNILIQQAAAGASLMVDDVVGKIGSLKAGSTKVALFYDDSGTFSITHETRANIIAANTAGTDTLTALGNGNVGIGDTTPVATFVVGNGDLFQVAGATGTVTTAGGYLQSGTIANTLSGPTSLTATGTALTVTNAASVGTLTVTTGGASILGATTINTTGTANTNIGNATGTFSLNSSALDISAAGAISGATTITASGNVNTSAGVYQVGGISGITVAACTAAQYIGNGATLKGGIITAGSCHADGVSDARLKQDITSISPASALDSLNQLRPVSYQYNDLYHQVTGDATQYGTQYGFIAQEVQQVMPGLVNADLYGQGGYYGIDYHAFSGLLTAAVQELSQKVDNIALNNGGEVITPKLTSNGALVINSGSSGNVALDSGANSAYVKIGTEKAAGVSIARAGVTTDIGGALNVDGSSNFNGPVTMDFATAQNLSVTNDLKIDTASFKVIDDGNVSAKSYTSKNGSFQMLDAAGTNVVTIDNAGNANFAGNLNIASASLSGGLNVAGDVNVAGLSTFQKLATFIGKTIFRQDVQFDGHITVAKDGAGYATLRTTETTVHVKFKDDYQQTPVVSATISNGKFAVYTIDHVDSKGFDITLKDPATVDTTLSWTAIGVNDPQTAVNPPPATL